MWRFSKIHSDTTWHPFENESSIDQLPELSISFSLFDHNNRVNNGFHRYSSNLPGRSQCPRRNHIRCLPDRAREDSLPPLLPPPTNSQLAPHGHSLLRLLHGPIQHGRGQCAQRLGSKPHDRRQHPPGALVGILVVRRHGTLDGNVRRSRGRAKGHAARHGCLAGLQSNRHISRLDSGLGRRRAHRFDSILLHD